MLEVNLTPFPELYTERLHLRQITRDDVPEIFVHRSHPEMLKYLERAPATSFDDAHQFIDRVEEAAKTNNGISWGITLKQEEKLIGTIALWRFTKEDFRAEIGYMLHPDFHHQGIMNEAMQPVLDWAFRVMKFHSIEANVNPKNVASIKLLESNKFVREAYFRENYYFDGNFFDSAIYSLITPYK